MGECGRKRSGELRTENALSLALAPLVPRGARETGFSGVGAIARIIDTPVARRTSTRPPTKTTPRPTHQHHRHEPTDTNARHTAHNTVTATSVTTNARTPTHVTEANTPRVNRALVHYSHASNRHTPTRATRTTHAPTTPRAIVRARRKVGSRCSGKRQFALRSSALNGHEARPTERLPHLTLTPARGRRTLMPGGALGAPSRAPGRHHRWSNGPCRRPFRYGARVERPTMFQHFRCKPPVRVGERLTRAPSGGDCSPLTRLVG